MRPARVLALVALALPACGRAPRVDPIPEPAAPVVPSAQPSSSAASASPAPPPPAPEAEDPFPWPPGYTPPEIWERRAVPVDGVTEIWSLRWKKPPRFNGCAPSTSCMCAGLEWGLVGELELVRERPGAAAERLDLGKLREGGAQIPGFVQVPSRDSPRDARGRLLGDPPGLEQVVKRPHAPALVLGDYDHDGRATEMVFQTGYVMCGQQPSVLVGVSRAEPFLHVFHTVESPGSPLTMLYTRSWEELRRATGKTVDLALQDCGDHGGSGYYLTLRFDPAAGIHLVDSSAWACDFTTIPPHRTVRTGSAEGILSNPRSR